MVVTSLFWFRGQIIVEPSICHVGHDRGHTGICEMIHSESHPSRVQGVRLVVKALICVSKRRLTQQTDQRGPWPGQKKKRSNPQNTSKA